MYYRVLHKMCQQTDEEFIKSNTPGTLLLHSLYYTCIIGFIQCIYITHRVLESK